MIKMNIRGGPFVEKTLREIAPKEAESLMKATVGALATDVIREAKKGMNFSGPYSTGRMKKSVKKRVRRTRKGIIQTDVTVGKRAFYWRFYEYGDGDVPRVAMFGNAIRHVGRTLGRRTTELFLKKLTQRLERRARQNRSKVRR